MSFVIGVVAFVAVIVVVAFLMDRSDRRHGRKSHIRLRGLLEREGQIMSVNSPVTYLADDKGISSDYSMDPDRDGNNFPTD